MKLEFLGDLSDGGRFTGVVSENLVRLYDFNKEETRALMTAIRVKVIEGNGLLDLSQLDFIESLNCRLLLERSGSNEGICRVVANAFTCRLTIEAYREMLAIMEKVTTGFNWLCDTSKEDIDFLYSVGGAW
jgi:hypothetical protein